MFPATSPNALPGECAIVYKLTGPSFAVGAGLDGAMEALRSAAELVAAGDAETMVVVAADDAGPAARALVELAGWGGRRLEKGAVAVLLGSEGAGAMREMAIEVPVAHEGEGPIGHLALRAWLGAG